MATLESEEPVAQDDRGEESESPESTSATLQETPETEPEIEPAQRHEEPQEQPQRAPGPRGRTGKAKRSSVPSWDEIVFGSNSN